MVTDLLPAFSNVWSLSKITNKFRQNRFERSKAYSSENAFVGHHSDSKVIDASCVILTAHYFRSHVPWRT